MSIIIPDRYKNKKYLANFYVLKYLESKSEINLNTLYDKAFEKINIFKFLTILENKEIIESYTYLKLIRYLKNKIISLEDFLKIINIEKIELIKLLNFYYSSISREEIEDDKIKELYKNISKYYEVLPKEYPSKFQKVYESSPMASERTTSISLVLNLDELQYDFVTIILIEEIKTKEEKQIKELFEALEELEMDDFNLGLIEKLKRLIYENFI